jgi:hypothetical protein
MLWFLPPGGGIWALKGLRDPLGKRQVGRGVVIDLTFFVRRIDQSLGDRLARRRVREHSGLTVPIPQSAKAVPLSMSRRGILHSMGVSMSLGSVVDTAN